MIKNMFFGKDNLDLTKYIFFFTLDFSAGYTDIYVYRLVKETGHYTSSLLWRDAYSSDNYTDAYSRCVDNELYFFLTNNTTGRAILLSIDPFSLQVISSYSTSSASPVYAGISMSDTEVGVGTNLGHPMIFDRKTLANRYIDPGAYIDGSYDLEWFSAMFFQASNGEKYRAEVLRARDTGAFYGLVSPSNSGAGLSWYKSGNNVPFQMFMTEENGTLYCTSIGSDGNPTKRFALDLNTIVAQNNLGTPTQRRGACMMKDPQDGQYKLRYRTNKCMSDADFDGYNETSIMEKDILLNPNLSISYESPWAWAYDIIDNDLTSVTLQFCNYRPEDNNILYYRHDGTKGLTTRIEWASGINAQDIRAASNEGLFGVYYDDVHFRVVSVCQVEDFGEYKS